jgi:acetyltransferase-like isoleucine patch superfamily enzyme
MLVADPSAKVSPLADIDQSTRGTRILVGPGSQIDSFVRVKCAGGTADVVIGKGCYINSGTVIYTGNGLTMGNDVLVAANCTFAPVNHACRERGRTIIEQRFLPGKGGIVIGDDVWIGAGCVILDGARIPRGVVIGACSLVRGKLEEYGIYAGNPIKKIGERT